MASSGSITTNEKEGRSITLSWSLASQNIANNTSTITWTLKGSGSSTGWVMSGAFKAVINGKTVYSSATRIQLKKGQVIASGNTTITHNADGSKSFSLSCEAGVYTYAVSVRASGTHTLNTIPRASGVSATSTEMDSISTITISRASSAFTHTLTYTFGGASGTIVSKTASTSVSWTPSLSLASEIPNAISGTCTITCDTYNGSSKIGTKSCTLKLTVPSSVKPSIGSLSISRVNGDVPPSWNVYIQSKSKATITINAPSGIYGSTISSYYITGGGYSSTSSSFTTSFLGTAGTVTFTARVTDSRGRTSDEKAISIVVLPYEPPSYSSYLSQRANSDATLNDDGKYVKGIVSFKYSSCSNRNSVYTSTYYKKSSEIQWTNAYTSFVTDTSFTFGNGLISTEYSYDVKYVISDAFSTITIIDSISTAAVLMDFKAGGRGIAIGKVAETDMTLEIAQDWQLIVHGKELIDLIYPVGSIYMSVNGTDPSLLFGGVWSRISEGRTLVGFNQLDNDFNLVGKIGGEKVHKLTIDEMPSHRHSMSMSNQGNGVIDYCHQNANSKTSYNDKYKYPTDYTGGSQAHNNMPPYLVVYMWKRIS